MRACEPTNERVTRNAAARDLELETGERGRNYTPRRMGKQYTHGVTYPWCPTDRVCVMIYIV